MTRRQKDPLRVLTEDERAWLERISRATSEEANHVARAKALLAVANGATFTAAAQAAGRRSGDAVAHLVARFNRESINALVPGHAGGQPITYTLTARDRTEWYYLKRQLTDRFRLIVWDLPGLGLSTRPANNVTHRRNPSASCLINHLCAKKVIHFVHDLSTFRATRAASAAC